MPDQSFDHIDAGRNIDWGKTSEDYDRHRPGPPPSFYARLEAFGLGVPGQRILDLGTGTGVLARQFARQGATVGGIDVSADQIAMARQAAEKEGLEVDFRVAGAEQLPSPDASLDLVSALQCWMYFDLKRTIPEVRRVLTGDGHLLVAHFSFMPRLDEIVRASERLVLTFNPDWSGADWNGVLKPEPGWAAGTFELVGYFAYDEPIPFTRESWRGRMRALRGIAASLPPEAVERFDAAHQQLLEEIADETFDIWHRIHAQIFRPIAGG